MAKGVKGFKKGESGNKAGKPVGTKSQKTIAWENLGEFITEAGAEKVKEILTKASPKDFMDYYTTLLEYFKPKQQRIENNVNVQDNILEIKRTVYTKDPNES
jgi:hypothetical protein